jgi:hypothetical protein
MAHKLGHDRKLARHRGALLFGRLAHDHGCHDGRTDQEPHAAVVPAVTPRHIFVERSRSRPVQSSEGNTAPAAPASELPVRPAPAPTARGAVALR